MAFFLQIIIFLIILTTIALIIGKMEHKFAYLALTIYILAIVFLNYINRNEIADRTFLTVFLFCLVPLGILIKRVIRVKRLH